MGDPPEPEAGAARARPKYKNLPESPTTTVKKGAKLQEARAKIRERRAQIRSDAANRTSAASPVKASPVRAGARHRPGSIAAAAAAAPAGPEEAASGAGTGAAVTSPRGTRPLSSRAPKLVIDTAVGTYTGLSGDEHRGAITMLDGAAAKSAAIGDVAVPSQQRPPPPPVRTGRATRPTRPPAAATSPDPASPAKGEAPGDPAAAMTMTPPQSSAPEAPSLPPNSADKPVYDKGFFGKKLRASSPRVRMRGHAPLRNLYGKEKREDRAEEGGREAARESPVVGTAKRPQKGAAAAAAAAEADAGDGEDDDSVPSWDGSGSDSSGLFDESRDEFDASAFDQNVSGEQAPDAAAAPPLMDVSMGSTDTEPESPVTTALQLAQRAALAKAEAERRAAERETASNKKLAERLAAAAGPGAQRGDEETDDEDEDKDEGARANVHSDTDPSTRGGAGEHGAARVASHDPSPPPKVPWRGKGLAAAAAAAQSRMAREGAAMAAAEAESRASRRPGEPSTASASNPASTAAIPGADRGGGLGDRAGASTAAAQRAAHLSRPVPKDTMLRCRLVRKRSAVGNYPTYALYVEDGGDGRFLLAARRRKKSATSNYVLSVDPDDLSREGAGFCAKLRANYLGNHYVLFDAGDKRVNERRELAAVRWKPGVASLGGGPRQVNVVLPISSDDPAAAVDPPPTPANAAGERGGLHWTDREAPAVGSGAEAGGGAGAEEGNLMRAYERQKKSKGAPRAVLLLRNKKPTWDPARRANVLDFQGRVTETSVKNFQLVAEVRGRGNGSAASPPS